MNDQRVIDLRFNGRNTIDYGDYGVRLFTASVVVIEVFRMVLCIKDGVLADVDTGGAIDQAMVTSTMHIAVDQAATDVDECRPTEVTKHRMSFVRTVSGGLAAAVNVTVNMAVTHIHRLQTTTQTVQRHVLTAAIHRTFHFATVDVDHLLLPHGAHVGTRKDAIAYVAAVDIDSRVALHQTSRRTHFVVLVLVDTTSAAVHVAFQVVVLHVTNLTGVHRHLGVHDDVAVFTATKHRALDDVVFINLTVVNMHIGVGNVG